MMFIFSVRGKLYFEYETSEVYSFHMPRTLKKPIARVEKKVEKKIDKNIDKKSVMIILGTCCLAALVLWSGSVITELAMKLEASEHASQIWKAGTDGASDERERRLTCEGELDNCQGTLGNAYDQMKANSVKYVLDSGAMLAREWRASDEVREFWLEKPGEDPSSSTTRIKVVEVPEVVESSGKGFAINKLSNGLYKFAAIDGNLGAGVSLIGLIDPNTLNFFTFTNTSEKDEGYFITAPGLERGFVTAHIATENCATSSTAVVDRLDWNGEVLYAFKKPPTIKCSFSQLIKKNVYRAFVISEDGAVARDLKSFVLTMQNGQQFRLRLNGAEKPTVTVIR